MCRDDFRQTLAPAVESFALFSVIAVPIVNCSDFAFGMVQNFADYDPIHAASCEVCRTCPSQIVQAPISAFATRAHPLEQAGLRLRPAADRTRPVGGEHKVSKPGAFLKNGQRDIGKRNFVAAIRLCALSRQYPYPLG